ncbi:MAG: energy transducer TonB [Verrucomicrobiota bacterium]
MNSTLKEPLRWSKSRWATIVLVIIAAQIILATRFSSRLVVVPRQIAESLVTLLPNQPAPGTPLAEAMAIQDPTTFALVNPHGFSGEAWLNLRPFEHRVTDWISPPYWLKPSTDRLGAAFSQFVRSNQVSALTLAESAAPPAFLLPLVSSLVPTQSTLRVEGDLAHRPLLSPIKLTGVPHHDLLSNSVVRVMVNRSGRVLSHALLTSSGSPNADQLALNLSRNVRFQSLRTNDNGSVREPMGLIWGQLIFQWLTLQATNATPGAQ